jgi:FAD/FMN-containing dehydrogenase
MLSLISAHGRKASIAGSRHAMGGQQFGSATDLIDITALNRVLSFDRSTGVLEVEGGITWPSIIEYCWRMQQGDAKPWSIIQKQTGADSLTLGGALSANIHGRGLTMRPVINDVEAFQLITPNGDQLECSRFKNSELFRLAIGGYGLFGVISRIKLRLMPRSRLKRRVKILDIDDLMPAFEQRIVEGCLYGDFQYMTDATSTDFLRKGVFSCYLPVESDIQERQHRDLSVAEWKELYRLAFANKRDAYEAYSNYYLSTDGQFYWSDMHQLSIYLDDYHVEVNRKLGFEDKASLMISEIYVPREHLAEFMGNARALALKHDLDIIYGTIRLIEKDDESALPWAKDNYACIIFNLRVFHTPQGIRKAEQDFCALIDVALPFGGSYYLTYHRWARKDQLLSCYPEFPKFLQMKRRYDPMEVIESDWYRHHKAMMAE